jgi:hypothetical protein
MMTTEKPKSATWRSIKYLIEAIHATPHLIVLEFTGAGAQSLAWLHSIGGSSRTILEATDRYSPTSLIELLGFTPQQFVAPEVAHRMAVKAFYRASRLAPILLTDSGPRPVIGVGCTATIATDRFKRGGHQAYVAICDARKTTVYGLTMAKGRRSREQEERLISQLIVWAVASACENTNGYAFHDFAEIDAPLTEQTETISLLGRFISDKSSGKQSKYCSTSEVDWLLIHPNGQIVTTRTLPKVVVFPGSFNPLHKGHRSLAQVATEITGYPTCFELSLTNADKSPADWTEIKQRLTQFIGFAPLLLTQAPLFSQKAKLFPNSTFIIGHDTAVRLLEPRFYNGSIIEMDASLQTIRAAGCQFLVAGRLHEEKFLTLSDIDLLDYQDLFTEIPPAQFRVDVSSTEIRSYEVF